MKLALWRAADDAIEAWLMRVGEVRREVYLDAAEAAQLLWRERFEKVMASLQELADNQSIPNDQWPSSGGALWPSPLHGAGHAP